MNWLETQFWRVAIWLIKRGYGCDCETKDLDDIEGLTFDHPGRCASCHAKEIVEWIEYHIEILNP